ncbi:hypothetical protein C5L39_09745 [Corynebacterium alimapuense]|uniref:Uncharacterized protein n=2 Tax=Corynebacterium alimapuense TaxID=1576874 RepID=A0A3M8K4J4_9CORY|nr:hypothetical protein C5L39_09745 [Corynebacterium alimapuense]
MALSTASAAYRRVKNYREEKAREAYDRLAEAASGFDFDQLQQRSSDLLDDSRREAGNVTRAARVRLDKALEELEAHREEAADKAGKGLKKAKKNLPVKEKPAKATSRKGRFGKVGLLALLLGAAGGAAYYWLNRRPEPGETPPSIQDFLGSAADETGETTTESTLVYSTSTPTDGSEQTAGPLAEDPAVRDEELLNSLEEQLEKHRSAALDEAGEDQDESPTTADDASEETEETEEKDSKA